MAAFVKIKFGKAFCPNPLQFHFLSDNDSDQSISLPRCGISSFDLSVIYEKMIKIMGDLQEEKVLVFPTNSPPVQELMSILKF